MMYLDTLIQLSFKQFVTFVVSNGDFKSKCQEAPLSAGHLLVL